jgi:hypothetical protein
MTKPPASADGLDITRPDELTQAEIDAFRAYYAASKGQSLAGLEFWLEFRPDVLKRYRLGVRETGTVAGRDHPMMRGCAWLQYYTVARYEEGIGYQIHNLRSAGASKAVILDTLAVAFLHSGPPGIEAVARSSQETLRTYEDPPAGHGWPDGWSVEPGAFDSGMDFSDTEATASDLKSLEDWYRRALGEVPGSVAFLAAHQPRFLKAYRNRFEHALRGGLPKQMMAYLLLNLHVVQRNPDGIREAALLGRWMGMTKGQLLDAALWGFYFGGMEAFGLVEEAAGDVFRSLA